MMFLGIDYNLSRRLIVKISYKIYCICLIILVTYATMTCCEGRWSLIWSLLEYVVYMAVMIIYRSKIALSFQKTVEIDVYLRINKRNYYKTRNRHIFIFFVISLIRICYLYFYCTDSTCNVNLDVFVFYPFSLLALDITRVWRYCIFEGIWHRIRLLRIRLEDGPADSFYMYVKGNKTIRENKPKFSLFLYRSIGDVLEMMSPELSTHVST
jgi:hypothetical protein